MKRIDFVLILFLLFLCLPFVYRKEGVFKIHHWETLLITIILNETIEIMEE